MFRPTRLLNLALQGGGAHGAFTWGVLDVLLEDGRVTFDGVSGTSAGAMNALVLAQGWMDGGRDGAREALRRFWSSLAGIMPVEVAVEGMDGEVRLTPALKLWLHWTHYIAPVQINPLGLNPLRDLIESQIDFERLRRDAPFALFVAATHANSGRLRVFRNAEMSADALIASACLPTLFHAPLIDDEPYWDGGYAGLTDSPQIMGVKSVLAMTLGVTLLNPHVYLDTLMLLGSFGSQFAEPLRPAFAAGAMLASLVWFYSLAFGAAALSPWLARGKVQQAIDVVVGIIMLGLAAQLASGALMAS